MPGSKRENDADVKAFVIEHDVKTVLDVGTGFGTYADLLGDLVDEINGVEVWAPYVNEFDLRQKYNILVIGDARRIRTSYFDVDLVIFGDVLEHMSAEDSQILWKQAGEHAKYGLISVPIVHWPQGPERGNPYEVHVQEHMRPEEIRRDYGPFVFDKEYDLTGTFIKEFK